MALRPILVIPDPRLRKVAAPVKVIDAGIERLAADMFETMYDAPGIGLAANQVGVLKRVVVIDVVKDPETEPPQPITLVNPEITALSEVLRVHEEGCLSIPEYYADVSRPDTCTVTFLDLKGERQTLDCDDVLATAVQHEIDHLNGRLFIDYLSRLKRDMVTKKFAKQARRAG
ncbi:MAG TPA: peptide deformylase [Devosiaceae bacterium]|nr:peptide deformylase [Devosiaceae bacterium]